MGNMWEGMEEKNKDPMNRIQAVSDDLQTFKASVGPGGRKGGNPRGSKLQQDLQNQIAQLEAQMRAPMKNVTEDAKLIAVVGGLESMGDEWSASKLIKDRLWEGYVTPASDYFVKGEFKGLSFAIFPK
eukprot:9492913-Pyramimonas_sp.AAC.1